MPEERARYMVQAATARTMAIFSHVAVVLGMVLIGVWHFDNIRTGIAAAHALFALTLHGTDDGPRRSRFARRTVGVGRGGVSATVGVGHVAGPGDRRHLLSLLPAAAVDGLLLASRITAVQHRVRVDAVPCCVGLLAFTSADFDHFLAQVKMMFGWTSLSSPGVEGFWLFHASSLPYRIPILALYAVMCAGFALWPTPKNLGTLLSCSAAVMLGTQFWQINGGSLYIAWYLPLLLLTIFRPNLEDRIALATLGEWIIRGRVLLWRCAA